MKWRAGALELPASRARRRPPDIVYGADDRPTGGLLMSLAGQHTIMAIALSAYAIAAARIGGLGPAETQGFLAATLLAMAGATLLQAWGGKLGAGALIVHIPDPIMVPFAGLVLRDVGLSGLLVLGLAAAAPALLLSGMIARLRVLFPPAVLGVVVTMGGISLVESALRHALGLGVGPSVHLPSFFVAGITLATIVAVSVWAPRKVKLFGLLAGILAGVFAAALGLEIPGLEQFGDAAIFALPAVPQPSFAVPSSLIAVIVMVALLAQFDTCASVVIMDKIDDTAWHRPDMRMIGRGIFANGLGNLAAGVLGGMPNGPSTASIGLAHATHATARWIGIAAALLIAVVACLPQVTLLLTLIPTPVIGAIEVYAAAYLIVSGIELAASRALDNRSHFMIGISLVIGVGVTVLPQIAAGAPAFLTQIAGSGFAMAGLSAILLNLLFRIGVSQNAVLALDGGHETSRTIVDFVESQGSTWAARRDVVNRAALAAMEATELILIHGSDRRPTAIRARFDEYNFDIEIVHKGAPITLRSSETPDLSDLIDADERATMLAMSNVSSVLVQRLADRVRTGMRDGNSFVHLHFDH